MREMFTLSFKLLVIVSIFSKTDEDIDEDDEDAEL